MLLAAVAALVPAGCVSTSAGPNTTGVELAKDTTPISAADNANGPLLVPGPGGTLHVFWAEANEVLRKVSTDGGETFGPAESLLDVGLLGNITAGRNQPRPVAAVVDGFGDTHLLVQVADPADSQRSDIYYSHVETYAVPTDKAIVTGGRDLSGQALGATSVYDGRTRQWEAAIRPAAGAGLTCAAGLPAARDATRRWGHASAALGGKVYVSGGQDVAGLLTGVQAYDNVRGTWLEDSPLPGPRTGHALVSDGRYLYAVGGRDAGAALDSILRFDPAGDVTYTFDASGAVTGCAEPGTSPWTPLAAFLPVGRTRLAVVGVARSSGDFEIHVLGGETFAGNPQATTDAFRVEADGSLTAIAPLPPLPGPRSRHEAVAVGERIFVLGGTSDGSDILDTVYTIDLAAASPAWQPAAAMPEPRRDHAAVVLGGEVYVLGGTAGQGPIALVDVYDPATDTWRTDPESAAPAASADGAAAVVSEASFPRNLSRQAANATQPALTRDPDSGDLYAVWRNEQEVAFGQFETRVTSDVYLTRSADRGATFSAAPVRLSGLGPLAAYNSNFSGNPQVAIGAGNLIHLAWIETGEPGSTATQGQDLIYTNCAPDDAVADGIACGDTLLFFPSAPGEDGDPPAGTMRSPSLATDAVGGVYLAWVDRDGTVPIARQSAIRTYALNVYFTHRLSTGGFATPAPLGVRLASRQDELFPEGTVSDPVAAVASLATRVDVPRVAAWGDGQVNVLWTNDSEARLRRSRNGGRTFLDEVGVAGLASGVSRIGPDLAYDAAANRLIALWQDLSAGAAVNEVNSLVETRFIDPL